MTAQATPKTIGVPLSTIQEMWDLGPTRPPIPMILFCPKCHQQHIDAPDFCKECPGGKCMCVRQHESWTNPPHRSHLCKWCGCIWRPADVPTTGVATISTHGKNDTYVVRKDG